MTSPSNAKLLELLDPVLARVASLLGPDGTGAELEAILEREFPAAGEHAGAIGRELAEGIAAGWLCDRGDADARFSRIAKAGPGTHGLSIDVVSMIGAGLVHTHPKGEVTLGFSASAADSCQFESRPPGWVFLGPGSRHVPTVTGARMNLIYFLPDGAVEWR